ncbi:tRNA pseudouridine(55) synthase TruB [Haloimpatiens sp. FM7330]|uniref:tRNA pseudouridine(55) synthase TruB n=1 Tax=Haloimpatiens sp. FM7330 TaxID=3298610 RepID=UPI00362B3EFB
MLNGVLNIYKPKGITSFDVVRKIRKISSEKKVGHAGTLDPQACGVLPVCIGRSTKIINYIMENSKTYITTLKLGIITDTYDTEGKIIKTSEITDVTNDKIIQVVKSFEGSIEQIPPMYSAIKVNGKRLYELARKGIEIERKPRNVVIHEIQILNIDIPFVQLKVSCSKGTYIRSLCYDIGEKLKCGSVMWELERTKTGQFTKENSIELSELNTENIQNFLMSSEEVLKKYSKIEFSDKFGKLLKNGVVLKDKRAVKNVSSNVLYRVYCCDNFLGLGMLTDNGFKLIKQLG